MGLEFEDKLKKRKIEDSDDEAEPEAPQKELLQVSSEADFMTLLRFYYARLFPYKFMTQWLSYERAPKEYLAKREFSFTLEDDIYIRYLSFSDKDALKKAMQEKLPVKIDIGAIFTHAPKDHKTIKATEFQPVEKEVVFDIDMTDYDEIRTCCSGAAICNKCWKWMNLAVKIIDATLREDFGFKHLLWVYSGRRGIHCWVCDTRARKLSNEKRAAIAEYMNVFKGGDSSRPCYLSTPIHPSLERAEALIKRTFKQLCIIEQGILDTPERYNKVLDLLPDESIKEEVLQDWRRSPNKSSEARWDMLERVIVTRKSKAQAEKNKLFYRLDALVREIMFNYTYPRLDINVSKQQNHLLKSPFVIHPKTGRVCVPFDPAKVDSFNPEEVPQIGNVFKEVNAYNDQHPDAQDMKDYQKTSLRHSFDFFAQSFLRPLLRDMNSEKKAASADSMEF